MQQYKHLIRSGEYLRTRDEMKIAITVYKPVTQSNKLLVIGSSAFVTQQCYESLAIYFAEQGITVITFDYRGIGLSQYHDIRKYSFSLHQWGNQDLDTVLLFAKNNFPGKELVFLGHGVSGEIMGLAAASQYINRVILINTALSCSHLWPLKGRIRIMVTKALAPLLNLLHRFFPRIKLFSAGSLPKGVMNEWRNWGSRDHGLFDVFPDCNYRRLQVPLLAYSFSDDWRSPRKAVSSLLRHFSEAAITWRHSTPRDYALQQIGHSGFFHQQCEPLLWKRMLYWLDDKI